jgi:hypothetical protein
MTGREKMVGDADQYRDLMELYGTYGDEELVELSRTMGDLTEMAQEILKGEMGRRGLKVAAVAQPAETRVLTDEDLADMRTYAEVAPAECIFDFESEQAASGAYYALMNAGIEAIVISASRSKFDNRGPRVVVKPENAKRAAEILSAPATETLELEGESAAEGFDLPRCPACGGEEILLESVDPVNEWKCDGCGHQWMEESVSPSA